MQAAYSNHEPFNEFSLPNHMSPRGAVIQSYDGQEPCLLVVCVKRPAISVTADISVGFSEVLDPSPDKW